MSPLYGLILQCKGELQTETVQVADAAQAWRLGRDRLTLTCLCMAEPIRRAVVGAATTEEEGFELVLRHKPSLLICTSDLETGYGMNLLRRVKAELPTCQLLIVLVRETQAVVQEAMQAYADAVIFKSSLGTGKGDFVQALQTLSEGCLLYTSPSPRD